MIKEIAKKLETDLIELKESTKLQNSPEEVVALRKSYVLMKATYERAMSFLDLEIAEEELNTMSEIETYFK